MRAWVAAAIGAAVFAADHATKWMAIQWLENRAPIDIVPGCFRLAWATNTGGAFSLLDESPRLLAGLAALSAGIVVWLFRQTAPEQRATRLGLALILGGAVANLADRFFRGYVIDFFDAYVGQSHWPTFNVADSAICVGAGLFVLFGLPAGLEEEAPPTEPALAGGSSGGAATGSAKTSRQRRKERRA
jgi:signal peptidase II